MKRYRSGTGTGTPVLNGAAGSLTDLLDAVLVDGYGLKTASSSAITGGQCTLTVTGGHAADTRMTILVSGATGAFTGLNGEQVVTATGANSVSFATGITGTPTGTITFKIAALGWTRAFTGTNKRAFKSASVMSTGLYLRVSDTTTAPSDVRVVGYETMTDVDTGAKPFPMDSQVSGGLYWPKSDTNDSSARGWDIWGDDRLFFIRVRANSDWVTNPSGSVHYFGDPISFKAGDAYGAIISGSRSNSAGAFNVDFHGGSAGFNNPAVTTDFSSYLARGYSGIGGAVGLTHQAVMAANQAYSGSSNLMASTYAFPNGPDNGLFVGPVFLYSENGIRGRLPGALFCPQSATGSFSNGTQVAGTGDYAGRTLEAVRVGQTTGADAGVLFVDLTGAWR